MIYRAIFSIFFFLLALTACEKEKPQTAAAPQEKAAQEKTEMEKTQEVRATAELKPTEGHKASGTVSFTTQDGAVAIVADLEGLEPGKHGFHVHETGDCSAPDASSAGGHFNPAGSSHGAPDNPPAQRHVGDLGNLEADADGMAHYERVDQVVTLEGPESIVGKAVVVHAGADDLTSQPSGNAGPRAACGVIELEE